MACPIARATDLIGDWWTPLVMREAFYGRRRFDEFQSALEIPRAVLTARLKRLCDEGMLQRVEYQQSPPRYEYRLTDKGRAFWDVLAAMFRWGSDWMWPDGERADGRAQGPRDGRWSCAREWSTRTPASRSTCAASECRSSVRRRSGAPDGRTASAPAPSTRVARGSRSRCAPAPPTSRRSTCRSSTSPFPRSSASSRAPSRADLSWIVTVYNIFFGSLLVVAGKIADQIGRKRVFLGGVGVFAVGSTICSLAPTLGVLIAGRAVQGVGGAFMAPASLGLLLAAFPAERRTQTVAMWGGVGALGVASGPSIGALLISAHRLARRVLDQPPDLPDAARRRRASCWSRRRGCSARDAPTTSGRADGHAGVGGGGARPLAVGHVGLVRRPDARLAGARRRAGHAPSSRASASIPSRCST